MTHRFIAGGGLPLNQCQKLRNEPKGGRMTHRFNAGAGLPLNLCQKLRNEPKATCLGGLPKKRTKGILAFQKSRAFSVNQVKSQES